MDCFLLLPQKSSRAVSYTMRLLGATQLVKHASVLKGPRASLCITTRNCFLKLTKRRRKQVRVLRNPSQDFPLKLQ